MQKILNPNTQPGNIRDPFIINVDGVYYMTCADFWAEACESLVNRFACSGNVCYNG